MSLPTTTTTTAEDEHTTENDTMGAAVLTLKQYATRERRALVAKYGVTLAEVCSLYSDDFYAAEWLTDHVVGGFEAGANISRPVWRTLPWERQQRVLRTRRALRDDNLTRELMRTSNSPGNVAPKHPAAG